MKLDKGCNNCGNNDFKFIKELGSKNIYKCNCCGDEILIDNGLNQGNDTELSYIRDRNNIVSNFQKDNAINQIDIINLQTTYPDYCHHDPLVSYFILCIKTDNFKTWKEEFESDIVLTEKNPLFDNDLKNIEYFNVLLYKLISKYNKQKDSGYKKKKMIIKLSIISTCILIIAIAGLIFGIEFNKMNIYINSYNDLMTNGSAEIEYKLIENGNKNEYVITGAKKTANGEIYIPEEHNGYKVTKIDDKAFEDADWLNAIRIPNTIEYIGENSFHNTGLEFEDNRLYIGQLDKLSVLESDKAIWPVLKGYYNEFLNNLDNYYSNIWLVEYNDSSKSIIIKEETVGISRNVFSNTALEELTLNEDIKYISYDNGDKIGNINKVYISNDNPSDMIKLINNLFTNPNDSIIYINSVDELNKLNNNEEFENYNIDLSDIDSKAYLYFYNDLDEKYIYEADLNKSLNDVLTDIFKNHSNEFKNIIEEKNGYENILFSDKGKTEKLNKEAVLKSGKINIYSSYKTIIYNINYDLDGGSVLVDNADTYTIEDNITLINPTKIGYDFLGWEDENGNLASDYIISNSTGNKKITAKWDPLEYNITYLYGYDDLVETKKINYDSKINSLDVNRPGYELQGWYLGENKINDESYKYLEDIIVTAKWKAKKYQVYLGNDVVEVTFDEEYNFGVQSKDGYYFIGWVDDNNNKYTDDLGAGLTKWSYPNNIILKPKFESHKIEVFLDVNGGSELSSNKILIGFEEKLDFPTPKRNGYLFEGWFDDSTNKKINKDDIYNDLEFKPLYVYAKWNIDPANIAKYVNDGVIVKNSDEDISYKVYKTINSIPFKLTEDVIIDLSDETNCDFSLCNRSLPEGETRKENIDFANGCHNVYFVADSNMTFLNLYMHTVNLTDSNYQLNLNFINFNIITNNWDLLEQWRSDGNHSESGPSIFINTMGVCSVRNNKAGGHIFGSGDRPINNLYFTGSGSYTIKAGSGDSSSRAGTAINAKNVTIDRVIGSTFEISGGNGLNGANGVAADTTDIDYKSGKNGTIGGIGIECEKIIITNASVSISGGKGGKGGDGGKSTANSDAWIDSTKKGGNGGNGARGGIGLKCKEYSIFDINCIKAGELGVAGKGAKGFNDDPNHYGKDGTSGLAGFVIYDSLNYVGYLSTASCGFSQYAFAVRVNSDFDTSGHRETYTMDTLTYSDAYILSKTLNVHLATITSEEENNVLKELYLSTGLTAAWLGGTDQEKEGDWKWVTGEKFTYSDWATGEPNNDGTYGEHFLAYNISGKWNDCSQTKKISGFIVEIDSYKNI